MELYDIYANAKEDRHGGKNSHTMRFPFLNYYPLERYRFRTLRHKSPFLVMPPVFPTQLHPFVKVLKADDDLFDLVPSLQHQSVRQVTTYQKRTNQPLLSFALPSNQQFYDLDHFGNPLKKSFVDDTVVQLDYKIRRTRERGGVVTIDFGKPVLVKHMSLSGEIHHPPPENQVHVCQPGCIYVSWGGGKTRKKKYEHQFKTRKEKKENSIPQAYRKPPKHEMRLVSPIKQLTISCKNKQGKWCRLDTVDVPERCEDLIYLSSSCQTRFVKIEPLNYVATPTFELTYVFYGVEQIDKGQIEEKKEQKDKDPKKKPKVDAYIVEMARSYKRVVDGSDACVNLHKRIEKYRRGQPWTGRSSQEYSDMHAWLRMNQTKCKRYDSIQKEMMDEYKEWLEDEEAL